MDTGTPISRPKAKAVAGWREYRQWQRTPMRTPPQTDEQHVCLNCDESYDGNYCPRCGQAATVERFTFSHVMRQALDVWGMGGRKSMPRTIWHLIWRPGYMIYDYLHGHRQPYFSPFKMLFLVTAAFAIMVHVLPGVEANVDTEGKKMEKIEVAMAEIFDDASEPNHEADEYKQSMHRILQPVRQVVHWFDTADVAMAILFHLFVTLFVLRVFRSTPRMGKATAVEHFYAQVFIASQLVIFNALSVLLQVVVRGHATTDLHPLLTYSLFAIDFRHLYGYGWWKTLWKTLLVFLFYGIALVALITLFVLLMLIGAVAIVEI